jgi:hypothetical protein
LNAWSSYFALILVMPTLGVTVVYLLARSWKAGRREEALSNFLGFTFASIAVCVCSFPLFADMLATSDMNGAEVGGGYSPAKFMLSLRHVVFMGNPIPEDAQVAFFVLVILVLAIVALIRRPSDAGVISLLWVLTPFVVLGIVDSKHFVSLRYALFAMPFVIALVISGIRSIVLTLTRTSTRIRPASWLAGALAILVALSTFGLTMPITQAYSGAPIKPDWKGVINGFIAESTPQSCLVLLDGRAHAINNIIPFYLKEMSSDACVIDGRDPALVETLESHTDIWWAIGTQYYPKAEIDALDSALSTDGSVDSYFLALLIHPNRSEQTLSQLEQSKLWLQRVIGMIEPVGSALISQHPAARESLANILALECGVATPVDTITSLLDGYLSYDRVNGDLTADRARERLERGDLTGARDLAIRMVGVSPGDPAVYTLLADVERAAGNPSADGYTWMASVLSYGSAPADHVSFTGC